MDCLYIKKGVGYKSMLSTVLGFPEVMSYSSIFVKEATGFSHGLESQ